EASDADLLRVHTSEWVGKLRNGTLTASEIMKLEVPYSPELAKAVWLAAGGSGIGGAGGAGGGFGGDRGGRVHSGLGEHGEGFCAIHDVAVAIRRLQADGAIRRAAVVDTDVHHGNGTAHIFDGDNSVFTISIHQLNNYPAHKPPSDVDLDMADRVEDDEYLETLMPVVAESLDQFRPDIVFYVGGADPYCEDQLGGLMLTKKGLKERDKRVFLEARKRGIPVAATLAGGYEGRVEGNVRIHVNTIVAAREVVEESGAQRPAASGQ